MNETKKEKVCFEFVAHTNNRFGNHVSRSPLKKQMQSITFFIAQKPIIQHPLHVIGERMFKDAILYDFYLIVTHFNDCICLHAITEWKHKKEQQQHTNQL